MSKIGKKILSSTLSVTTTVWLSGALLFVPAAHGQTVADLTAQINSLLATIQQLQSQLAALQGGGGGAPTTTFTRNLTVGSTGADVKALQQFLNAQGYQIAASGAGSPGNESTFFGPLTRTALGKYQAAKNISPAAGYFGPITRSLVNSLGGVATTPPGTVPPPPGTGVAVNLAPGNPTGVFVPAGANNVEFLRLNIAGSGTVNTMIFHRTGAGAAADFISSGVYLLDETGTRLTTGRTVNTTTHNVTFTGIDLQVSGTRTVRLVAAMSGIGSGGAGNRNAFEITSAADVTTAGGAVTGNFPVRGSEFTRTSAGVPGVTIATSTVPSNPKVGEQKAKIATIKITNGSSTDDLRLKSLTLRYSGSVGRSNLSNFNLEYAGSVVAKGTSINAKDLMTLTFEPAFLLERGQNRTFDFFTDIAAGVRAGSAETIKWHVEDTNDLVAESVLYGYGAIVTNSWSNPNQVTIDGGQLTITFNGPTAKDVPTNGQDVVFLDFTMAAQNNLEIKKLSFNVSSTGLGGAANEKLTDFKVVDVATGGVIAGPHGTDITTDTTNINLTDTFTIGAGQSRRLNVKADIGSATALNTDTVLVKLNTFGTTDIKNVDNNTDVTPSSDVVPNSVVSGNTLTIKAPDLEITLTGAPSSRTVTGGTTNVDHVGFNFRAIADNIQIKTVKVSATCGSCSVSDLQNALGTLRLMVSGAQVGQSKSLTGSSQPLTAEFTNLNYTLNEGKSVTVVVNSPTISTNASNTTYRVYIADLSTDVTAVDTQGNSLSLTGNANGGATVVLTVAAPSLTIARIGGGSTDTDGVHIIAGTTRVLTRLEMIAINGDVSVNRLIFGVAPSSTNPGSAASTTAANVTSTGRADDVGTISLRQCADITCASRTDIAGLTGLLINATGDDASHVKAETTGSFFTIPRGRSAYFTLEAALNFISVNNAELADSGTNLVASLLERSFRAVSGNTTLTTFATTTGGGTSLGVTGNEKVLFRSEPTLSIANPGGTLAAGIVPVIDLTVGATGNPVGLKSFALNVTANNATVTAPTTSNVTVRDITGGANTSITLGTVSGSVITGGNTNGILVVFTNTELINPGAPKTYRVSLTAQDVSTGNTKGSFSTRLLRKEANLVSGLATNNASLLGAGENGGNTTSTWAWVWSDLNLSQAGTATDLQWANMGLVRPFPTEAVTIVAN